MHNCFRAVRAGRAALLVDADDYFRAFVQAAERATESIIILAWDFDSRTQLCRDEANPKRVVTRRLVIIRYPGESAPPVRHPGW